MTDWQPQRERPSGARPGISDMASAVQKITLASSRDIPCNKLVLSQPNVRRVRPDHPLLGGPGIIECPKLQLHAGRYIGHACVIRVGEGRGIVEAHSLRVIRIYRQLPCAVG